jgi:hypothetical protein
MERFHRIQESLAVKHLQKVQEGKRQVEALICLPFIEKMERLKELAYVSVNREIVSSTEMKLFEKTPGGVPEKTAKEILRLLLRLRKPGTTEELGPEAELLGEDCEVPVAEGGSRKPLAWSFCASWRPQSTTSRNESCSPTRIPIKPGRSSTGTKFWRATRRKPR